MNKVLAEMIAGLIPHKLTRNQWRGFLRYGPVKAWKLRRRLKKEASTPTEHYLTVCAIAKDEGPYFKEWLDWHIAQGVDKFYIYDNGSTDCTRQVLEPYITAGIVEYNYWPGYRQQINTYDDCMERHRLDSRWIAFIDLDEFIVPMKHKSIPEYLKGLEEFSVVEINWLIYGSGGAKKKEAGGVMERFHRHSQPGHILNRHVKSIVDPRRTYTMIGCHEAARIEGVTADSHGNPLKKNFRDRVPQQDVIRVNHYAVKSFEEFFDKQARGRASGRKRSVPLEYFDEYDLNDIED